MSNKKKKLKQRSLALHSVMMAKLSSGAAGQHSHSKSKSRNRVKRLHKHLNQKGFYDD